MKKFTMTLLLCSFYLALTAQLTPSDLLCKPTSNAQVVQFNEIIAQHYAPRFQQYLSEDLLFYPEEYDYIRAVDFDGDWSSINNANNIMSNADGFLPKVYYSVVWTNKHWIVAYAVFHPLDYSDPLGLPALLCLQDWHENDMEGVVYTIKRPTPTSGPLVTAYETICHECNDCWQNTGYEDLFYIQNGTHCVWPSTNFPTCKLGVPTNPCDPDRGGAVMYLPPRLTTLAPGLYGNTGAYELESMLVPGGLWAHRNDPLTFVEDSQGKDRFVGDDWEDNSARPPWSWTQVNVSNPLGKVCGVGGGTNYIEVNEFKNIRNNYNRATVSGPPCLAPFSAGLYRADIRTASCPIQSYKWEVSFNNGAYQTMSTSPTFAFSINNSFTGTARIRLKVTSTDGQVFYSIPYMVSISDDCDGGGVIFRNAEEQLESTGLEKVKTTVYPNPNSGYLFIKTEAEAGAMEALVYHLTTGQLVAKFTDVIAGQEIQLDQLSNGIYTIHLKNARVNDVHKISVIKD